MSKTSSMCEFCEASSVSKNDLHAVVESCFLEQQSEAKYHQLYRSHLACQICCLMLLQFQRPQSKTSNHWCLGPLVTFVSGLAKAWKTNTFFWKHPFCVLELIAGMLGACHHVFASLLWRTVFYPCKNWLQCIKYTANGAPKLKKKCIGIATIIMLNRGQLMWPRRLLQ